MKSKSYYIVIFMLFVFGFYNCQEDKPIDTDDLSDISYNPKEYSVQIPYGLQPLPTISDNPMTYAGVQLGRHLFYDPILSSDSTLSCSSCHNPRLAFTDGQAFSKGVNDQIGTRSSMSLLNIAYFTKGLFWDGRSKTLEDQALEPVMNPIELHEEWPNVISKFKRHANYPKMFREAFGINSKKEITQELAAKAIAQYERILLTGGNSLYAKQLRGEIFFDLDQQQGMDMFFNSDPSLPDAQCGHCHSAPTFSANDYFNNGLDTVNNLEDFKDRGRGAVTGILLDNGRFKAPTLFNIELTAPYMHDGRFKTLDEVMDHYTGQVKRVANIDPNVANLKINARQRKQVMAFIKTLLDTSYLQNPDVLSPF